MSNSFVDNQLVDFDDTKLDLNSLKAHLGDGELVPGIDGAPSTFRRKVSRMEEAEYTRKVKVPIVTKKVVPTTFSKRIRVKNFIEVDDFELVDEEYTVFEDKLERREKKGWQKAWEWQTVRRKRPVIRMEKKMVWVTEIVQVEHVETVEVETNREVDVHGFRIDEIEDRHLIEVEEWEVYELLPHKVGEVDSQEVRDLGEIRSEHEIKREFGTTIYTMDGYVDSAHAGLEVDTHFAQAETKYTSASIGGSGYTSAAIGGSGSSMNTTVGELFDAHSGGRYLQNSSSTYTSGSTTTYTTSGTDRKATRRAIAVDEY